MMTKWRIVTCLATLLGLISAAAAGTTQCRASIQRRLQALNRATGQEAPLDGFLDPALSPSARKDAAGFYSPPYTCFEILVQPASVSCSAAGATSEVEVRWKRGNEAMREAVTLRWVQRDGVWYIESARGPGSLLFLAGMIGFLLWYSILGVATFTHARRHGMADYWLFLSGVPPCWLLYWYGQWWLRVRPGAQPGLWSAGMMRPPEGNTSPVTRVARVTGLATGLLLSLGALLPVLLKGNGFADLFLLGFFGMVLAVAFRVVRMDLRELRESR